MGTLLREESLLSGVPLLASVRTARESLAASIFASDSTTAAAEVTKLYMLSASTCVDDAVNSAVLE